MAISSWHIIEINATVIIGLLFLFSFQLISETDELLQEKEDIEKVNALKSQIQEQNREYGKNKCATSLLFYDTTKYENLSELSPKFREFIENMAESREEFATIGFTDEQLKEYRDNMDQLYNECKLFEKNSDKLFGEINAYDDIATVKEGFRMSDDPDEYVIIHSTSESGLFVVDFVNKMINFLVLPFAISAAYEGMRGLKNKNAFNTDDKIETPASRLGIGFMVIGFLMLTLVLGISGVAKSVLGV